MASGPRRAVNGAVIGAIPGIVLFVAGMIVGGEAMLSFGVIGMMVALVGVIVGGVVGASGGGEKAGNAPMIGAIVGAVPGVAMIFIQTRLAFPVMLIGALLGWFIGTRVSHGSPPTTSAM